MSGWWLASYFVLWGLVVILCVVVVALARQIGTLHLRLGPRGALEIDDEGPPLGEAPLHVDTTDVEGKPVTVGGPGRPQLVMFATPGCRICGEVLPALDVMAATRRLEPILVTDVDAASARAAFSTRRARLVASIDLPAAWNVPGTPYVVVLDDTGTVRAKGTINNLEQFEGLVETAEQRVAEVVQR